MTGKRAILALFAVCMLLVVLPAVFAQDEETEQNKLFDDWVTEGDTFQVSGLDVLVTGGTVGGEGIFSFPQKTVVLEVGNCQKVDRMYICLDEWEYVIGGTVKIHGTDKQKYHIYITLPSPDVKVSRQAENSDMEIGESTRITATLSNNGQEAALGITYTEKVPPEFEVSIPNNVNQYGNTLKWQGSLPAGGSIKFAYLIRAKSSFSGIIPAVVDYKAHSVPKHIEDQLEITVTSLIGIDTKRDKKDMQYGEEDRVYITIKNKRSEDLQAEAHVIFPKSFYIIATYFNDTTGENSFVWNGKIDAGEEYTFITRFKADDAGMQRINVSVKGDFTDGKYEKTQEFIDVNVSVKEAELYFIPKAVKKGEETVVKVYLKNPNTYAEFKNIDVSASSSYFNKTIHLEKYTPLEYNDVLAFNVKPEENGTFRAAAEATYAVGSRKFTSRAAQDIKIMEEKPEIIENKTHEQKPLVNMTPAGNRTEEKPKSEWLKKIAGKIKEKQMFAVDYMGKSIKDVSDPFKRIFELRKALNDAIAKKKKS